MRSRSSVRKNKAYRLLTDGEKAAMLIMRGKHMGLDAIAEVVGRTPRAVKVFLEGVTKLAEASGVEYDFRDDLKLKSLDAVRAGLVDERDNYKRATIGVNVLKGIGVLQPDGVQINQLIAAVPPEWTERYLANTPSSINGETP